MVLLSPPTPNPSPSYFGPPNGLAVLGALLKQDGHEVRGYDWDRKPVEAMLADCERVLREDQPDFIGISALSVNRGAALQLAQRYKQLAPQIPMILGGPYPSLEPEAMLERCEAEFVCVQDGEETLPELVAAMVDGRDPIRVDGLALRVGGAIRRTKPRPKFLDLDKLPFPDFDLFDMQASLAEYARPQADHFRDRVRIGNRKAYAPNSAIMVLTSRGCVFQCSFCPMSYWKGKMALHSGKYVADLIEHCIERYGHRHFVMGDNLFSFPRDHAEEVCEELIRRDLGAEWICMTRADMVDPKMLQLMADAGCREISYGVESLSWDVQKAMKKNLRMQTISPAFQQTHDAGITSTLMMMIGNEGDTLETTRQTVSRARELTPDRILLNVTKVYPGTKLHDHAVERGFIDSDFFHDADDGVPLFYAAEVGADVLAEMEKWLRWRTVYVPSEGHDLDAIERDFALCNWRSQEAVLFGGEPLMRRDLPQILERVQTIKARRMTFYTSGKPLASKKIRDLVMHAQGLGGLIVPLYGMSESMHDARADDPGGLRQTRKGLLNWTRLQGKVQTWCWLDRRTVKHVPAWLEWLHAHGVRDVVFVYGRSQLGDAAYVMPEPQLPDPVEAGRALSAATATAERLEMTMAVTGLPECVVDRTVEIRELRRPFDERLDDDGQPISLVHDRQEQKSFAAGCDECSSRFLCEGLWTDVLEARGEAVLQPIREDRAAK